MYSKEPHHYQPSRVQVKNTFIDIPEQGIDHDDGIDLNKLRADMLRRQVSDPGSTCFARQLSGVTTPLPRAPEDEVVMEHGHTGALPGGDAAPPECALLGGGAAPPEADGYRTDSYGPLHFSGQAPASHQATPLAVAAHCAGRSAAAVEAQSAGLPPEWREARTAMMRNLPNKYTQQMLLNELNQSGFYGTFDFLYLPIDPETGVNRGYAFINFIQPCFAWTFKQTYEGRRMRSFNSGKIVGVMPAALQGFQANYDHYATARVNRGDPSTRPLFLREPDPSDSAPAAASRRGRRRRGGGASAIDLATRQQQRQRNVMERQQREEQDGRQASWTQEDKSGDWGDWGDSPAAAAAPGVPLKAAPQAGAVPPSEEAPKRAQWTANFCPHCGEKVQAHFLFCSNCGGSTAMPNQPNPRWMGEEAAMAPAASPAAMYYMVMPNCYSDASPPNSGSNQTWLAA